MKKLSLLFLFVFVSFTLTYAQRNLEVKEKTESLSVFTDKDMTIDASAGQAGATISCPITLNLTFSSNVDMKVDVYKTEERGGLRYYYLRFIVGRYRGASYYNRRLEVLASGYLPLRFPLSLQPSEAKSFEVFDPNATVGVGCFYQFFNEGAELFKQAFYIEAQEKYKLSQECTDMPADANIKERITDIDTILALRVKADEAYDQQNYKLANDYYQRLFSLNNEDQHFNRRLNESRVKYMEICNNYFNNAEGNFSRGKFEEAKKYYELVIAQSCPKITEAGLRLIEIQNKQTSRLQRAQVINYEFAVDGPFGLSIGRYREDKIGAYFTLRFNQHLFEAMRNNPDSVKRAEVNVSAGANIMVLDLTWLFVGLGYTGTGKLKSEYTDPTEIDFHLYDALSPEIGLLRKVGPIVLRYTFQYRFALKKDVEERIKDTQHVFGLGVCF